MNHVLKFTLCCEFIEDIVPIMKVFLLANVPICQTVTEEGKEKKGEERQVQHSEQSKKKIDPISFPGRRRGQQQQQTKKDSDSLRQRR